MSLCSVEWREGVNEGKKKKEKDSGGKTGLIWGQQGNSYAINQLATRYR